MVLSFHESEFLSQLGERVRSLRSLRDMSRRELARQSGISEALHRRDRGGQGQRLDRAVAAAGAGDPLGTIRKRRRGVDGTAGARCQGQPRAVPDAVGGRGQPVEEGSRRGGQLAARARPPRAKTVISYSIILSARFRAASGTDTPSCLAVFKFKTNSNFTGCSTGVSVGLAPLMIRTTYSAPLRRIELNSAP